MTDSLTLENSCASGGLRSHGMPGQTDNEVKNYWNSYLKKRVEGGA